MTAPPSLPHRRITTALVLAVSLLAGQAEAAPSLEVRPYKRAICGKEPCCLIQVIPAGKERKGETLEVAEFDTSLRSDAEQRFRWNRRLRLPGHRGEDRLMPYAAGAAAELTT